MTTITPTSDGDTPVFRLWLERHGVKVNDCYKVELADDEMTVYCYDRNEQGTKYVITDERDALCGHAAVQTPKTIKLLEPLPA